LNLDLIDQQLEYLTNFATKIGVYTNGSDPKAIFNNPYDMKTYPFLWNSMWGSVPDNALRLAINISSFSSNSRTKIMYSMQNITGINSLLGSIFSDTFMETQNPALALQATITTVLRAAYYDAVPFFDVSQQASLSVTGRQDMPQAHVGFIVVVLLVVGQSVLMVITVVVFVLMGRLAVLHNAWAAVLEVSTPEAQAFLGQEAMGSHISIHADSNSSLQDQSLWDLIMRLDTSHQSLS
jgi:hypothetical protein